MENTKLLLWRLSTNVIIIMNDLRGLYIEGTRKTPRIEFTNLTGELILEGRSIPENVIKVYGPLLEWINDYVKSPNKTTNLHIKLDYFNSASLIWIVKIIMALGNISLEGAILYIHFYFEAENFNEGITEELTDLIDVLAEKIQSAKIHIAFKTHGLDSDGNIIRELTIPL